MSLCGCLVVATGDNGGCPKQRSLQQKDVVEASEKAGIVITAYSPLGSDASPLLTNDVIVKVAKKYQVEPASILISYQTSHPSRTGMFRLFLK